MQKGRNSCTLGKRKAGGMSNCFVMITTKMKSLKSMMRKKRETGLINSMRKKQSL